MTWIQAIHMFYLHFQIIFKISSNFNGTTCGIRDFEMSSSECNFFPKHAKPGKSTWMTNAAHGFIQHGGELRSFFLRGLLVMWLHTKNGEIQMLCYM